MLQSLLETLNYENWYKFGNITLNYELQTKLLWQEHNDKRAFIVGGLDMWALFGKYINQEESLATQWNL